MCTLEDDDILVQAAFAFSVPEHIHVHINIHTHTSTTHTHTHTHTRHIPFTALVVLPNFLVSIMKSPWMQILH